jgi:predicted N-acetyltransferase YhbS
MAVQIRPERPGDAREIGDVVESAFGDASVAAFTEELRRSAGYVPDLTFVAEEDGAVAGVPLAAYDPTIRGRIVYPSFFPGPPGA